MKQNYLFFQTRFATFWQCEWMTEGSSSTGTCPQKPPRHARWDHWPGQVTSIIHGSLWIFDSFFQLEHGQLERWGRCVSVGNPATWGWFIEVIYIYLHPKHDLSFFFSGIGLATSIRKTLLVFDAFTRTNQNQMIFGRGEAAQLEAPRGRHTAMGTLWVATGFVDMDMKGSAYHTIEG